MQRFKLNWTPDRPDFRDHLYQLVAPRAIPSFVDLRQEMPGIVNQGSIGSCTANATVAGNFDFLQLRDLKVKGKQSHEFNSHQFTPGSRLFVYYNARAVIGQQSSDSGAYIRDCIKTLNQIGVCREDLWKYETGRVCKAPTKGPLEEASKFKISSYLRLQGLPQYLDCLSQGYPFAFGFTVYESFYSVGSDGIVSMPKSNEKTIGGHAVLAVGYDQSKSVFIVRNSWGSNWGDQGYMYMPFDYLNSTLSDDFWTIRV